MLIKLFPFFIFLCSLNLIGQEKLTISIDNPEPRVGQEVVFSISFDFLNDYFDGQFEDGVEFPRTSYSFDDTYQTIDKKVIFNDVKTYTVGPFNFEFNGVKYTTDSIEVNVLPALIIEEGLWLRQFNFQDNTYLIVEQFIKNNNSYSYGGDKPENKEFASLNHLLSDGINLEFKSSFSKTVIPKNTKPGLPGFSYQIQKYKVNYTYNYKGAYKLSKKDFIDLPSTFDLNNIKLKRPKQLK